MLTGGRRTALPRHQTLRATLDWSYELLAAGGEIAASEAVCSLANLVTKSLVTAEAGSVIAHHRLHETTRAYALKKLAESGEFEQVARRHANYYRDLFDRAEIALETLPAPAPVGRKGVTELLRVVADSSDKRVPEVARACLAALGTQLLRLKEQILEFDRMIIAWHRSNQTSKRLHYIPGVGPMLATALVASVADPRTFRSGRNFSAWIGLVPKQHSSGAKTGSAASANRATAIYAACSWPVHSPSSATPRSTAPSIDPCSRRC